MAEYIDREKAKGILIEFKNECWENRVNPNQIAGIKYSINELNKVPIADVQEVKHGYWKDTEYGICSVCDRRISEIYDADSYMSYGILDELTTCPFCGAIMDGGENG